jgi:hypothetical protein
VVALNAWGLVRRVALDRGKKIIEVIVTTMN